MDLESFNASMKLQKRARSSWKGSGDGNTENYGLILQKTKPTVFRIDETTLKANVTALVLDSEAVNELVIK